MLFAATLLTAWRVCSVASRRSRRQEVWSRGDRLFALSHAVRGPMCFEISTPPPNESHTDAGDHTMTLRIQSASLRRPSRNDMLPPRLPPITALKLLLIGCVLSRVLMK